MTDPEYDDEPEEDIPIDDPVGWSMEYGGNGLARSDDWVW